MDINKRIHLVSLGCAKNQVDSEQMLAMLKQAGWHVVPEPVEAEVIVVNTCSFIESAADESIETILELAQLKKNGSCRRLVVAGCLPERYRHPIAEALPEVDAFVGTGGISAIVGAVTGSLETGCYLPDPNCSVAAAGAMGRLLDDGPTAYLKISEGCDRHCTYCIIPRLRGRQQDRSIEDLTAEAEVLIAAGKKELVLVAQETTAFGRHLPGSQGLDVLLAQLSALDSGIWIRVMYGHPRSITPAIIDTVARYDNICSYFDIPVQHVSDAVLKAMGRRYGNRDLRRLFVDIRSRLPEVSLRTTLMTGFPGESENDFNQLLDFIREIRFDHLGVFMYSDSEDLASHLLTGRVSHEVTQERYERLMDLQQGISAENKRRHVGKEMEVLVEKTLEEGLCRGRSAFQAPEVDGVTMVKTPLGQGEIERGAFLRIRVTDALDYDLIGVAV